MSETVPLKPASSKKANKPPEIKKEILLKAYQLMCTAQRMAELYDENKEICSRYVHST